MIKLPPIILLLFLAGITIQGNASAKFCGKVASLVGGILLNFAGRCDGAVFRSLMVRAADGMRQRPRDRQRQSR